MSYIPFNGGLTIKCTDVNSAGPYVVQNADYALCVRYTATGAISIDLPAIASVGDGRVIGIIDSGYNCAVNNITTVRSGADSVDNVAGNYTFNESGGTLWLKSNLNTHNWEIL